VIRHLWLCGIFHHPVALKLTEGTCVRSRYATDPLLLAITALTIAVVVFARRGKQAKLETWEHRAASWYLWNASVFHLLLDWGVGTLKVWAQPLARATLPNLWRCTRIHSRVTHCCTVFFTNWVGGAVPSDDAEKLPNHGHSLRVSSAAPL
jgi:hypothetical protein